jgi:hypothetical protein
VIAVEAQHYTGRYMRDGKAGEMMLRHRKQTAEGFTRTKSRPTIMTPPTNVRYHIKSAFLENLALVLSNWLRYVYTIESMY